MRIDQLRFFISAVAIGLVGCETVANVAQGVADRARGASSQTDAKEAAPKMEASATPVPACVANFSVSGSFLSGKQFKSNVPLPALSPDAAYAKSYAAVVKRGWQIIQADKAMRVISANQQVSFSSGGKTVPLNIMVQSDSSRGSVLSFTFSTSGGLVTSEDAVRDGFCEVAKEVLS